MNTSNCRWRSSVYTRSVAIVFSSRVLLRPGRFASVVKQMFVLLLHPFSSIAKLNYVNRRVCKKCHFIHHSSCVFFGGERLPFLYAVGEC